MIDSLRWLRDQNRLRLLGFVVMPDHLHVAMALGEGWTLPKIMHSLKSFTAHQLGRLSQTSGALWQEGYHDHRLRDRRDFERKLDYMHDNPRRARLVKRAEEYRFSTAHPSFCAEIDWNWLGGVPREPGRGETPLPQAEKGR